MAGSAEVFSCFFTSSSCSGNLAYQITSGNIGLHIQDFEDTLFIECTASPCDSTLCMGSFHMIMRYFHFIYVIFSFFFQLYSTSYFSTHLTVSQTHSNDTF